MWVEPNGKVIILSGVPVDPTQTDVPWFASAGAQESFFKGFTLKTYSKVSFMRVNTSVPQSAQGNTGSPRTASTIRVPTNAAELYSANYLMFQNTSYSNKWFYAFVETVNPLSDNATEITYQIDDMQTWQFDFTLGACPLKREHIKASEDKIGANLVAEPFNSEKLFTKIGEYVTPTDVALLTTTDPSGSTSPTSVNNAFKQNIGYILGETNVNTAQAQFVEAKALSGIVAKICYAPLLAEQSVQFPMSTFKFAPTKANNYGYSQVKNKKLFTKQFFSLKIIGSDNTTQSYDVEGFSSETPTINFTSGGYPWLWYGYPRSYYGLDISMHTGTPYAIVINTGTSVPFGGSSYFTDLSTTALTGLLNTIRGAVSGFGTGGAIGAGVGAAAGIATTGANVIKAGVNPQRVQSISGDSNGAIQAALTNNKCGMSYGYNAITADEAKDIDEFFTYYGYATDGCRVPNGLYSNKRSVFNYVQTDGCIFSACSCPADSASNIKKIFDKGVRLWHDTSKIGTVVTDNS